MRKVKLYSENNCCNPEVGTQKILKAQIVRQKSDDEF